MLSHAYIFLDTNIALHYRRADQIDWATLCGAGTVTLVVAPVFVRELEKEKVHNRIAKLRDRAADTLLWLRPAFRSTEPMAIRNGVNLIVQRLEPSLDFGSKGLDPTIADDRLIAGVLSFQPANDAPVALATNDAGLEMKLPAFGIQHVAVPDELALPIEVDLTRLENERLRREIAQMRARSARLQYGFGGGEQHLALPQQPEAREAATLEEMRERFPLVPNLPALAPTPKMSADGVARFEIADFSDPHWEDRAYNRQVVDFLEGYSLFLSELRTWDRKRRSTFILATCLGNIGSAPATNIDATLWSPKNASFVDVDKLPDKPSPPDTPRRGQLSAGLRLHVPSVIRAGHPFLGHEDGRFARVAADGRSVRFHIRHLKQHDDLSLGRFALRFDGPDSVASTEIIFRVTANELPDPMDGRLVLRKPANQRV